MSIWRLQASWQYDSASARDRVTINPHFEVLNPAPDVQQLCQDLAVGLDAISPSTAEIQVKGYDAQGSKPVYPEGDAKVNAGGILATARPRELAMCLSYYGGRNVKRQRGRLFIPTQFLLQNVGTLRPAMPVTKMNDIVTLLTGLGGVDVDWCVYSRVLDRAFPVTNWWYDDEWDVMRSRGLKGTTRVQGTASEAGRSSEPIALRA
jgi:hypothetical protein